MLANTRAPRQTAQDLFMAAASLVDAALVHHEVLLEVPATTSSREFTIRKGARRK